MNPITQITIMDTIIKVIINGENAIIIVLLQQLALFLTRLQTHFDTYINQCKAMYIPNTIMNPQAKNATMKTTAKQNSKINIILNDNYQITLAKM
ncbi:unnamed protein product [Paramecium sonneborni]|uniref:Uncharacterized protein n=1 Tax=Paramecium sonneborni TaxID=65129 RepID=A0A8S1QZT4_9CILI|nr:unnamed protein product [Paramecium sonneborni]